MAKCKQPVSNYSVNNKEKYFLTIAETAEKTGLSQYYIRQGVKDGWIPYISAGNKYMVNYKLLSQILDEMSTEEAAEGGE